MSDVELTGPQSATDEADRGPRNLHGALLRYRVLAYVVGTGLVILVLIGVPLKYLAGEPAIATFVGIAHGYLFMVYLLVTFDLARRAGWRLTRVALVGLAGTVPFLSFYAERKVTGWVRADEAARLAA